MAFYCELMKNNFISINDVSLIDINECSTNGGKGQCDQICTNTIGSFTCSCQVGYSIIGFACNGKYNYTYKMYNHNYMESLP